jgi:hypothetical protein
MVSTAAVIYLASLLASHPVAGFPATPHDLSGMADLKCSGALVHLNRDADQPAVLLTNGHCVTKRDIAAGDAVVNGTYSGSDINLFSGAKGSDGVKAARILYATETVFDIALVELKATYRELGTEGAFVYDISDTDAKLDSDVQMVAGSVKQKQLCGISHIVPLLIEDETSTMDAYAMKEPCASSDKWFGAPMVDPTTLKIVGILNTTNSDGKLCTSGNPCEVDAAGDRAAFQGRTYGQRVSPILDCVSKYGQIDLSLPNCKLTKPKSRGGPVPPGPSGSKPARSFWPKLRNESR